MGNLILNMISVVFYIFLSLASLVRSGPADVQMKYFETKTDHFGMA